MEKEVSIVLVSSGVLELRAKTYYEQIFNRKNDNTRSL
jgi:hypothetical protein